jgi:hypothetical protein
LGGDGVVALVAISGLAGLVQFVDGFAQKDPGKKIEPLVLAALQAASLIYTYQIAVTR